MPSKRERQEFLAVPLMAVMFGEKKLVASRFRKTVENDAAQIAMFGRVGRSSVDDGLRPFVQRLFSAITGRVGQGASLSEYRALMEYVAEQYPPAWLNIARLYSRESGR